MSSLSYEEDCIECGEPIVSKYDHADWCPNHPDNSKFSFDGGVDVSPTLQRRVLFAVRALEIELDEPPRPKQILGELGGDARPDSSYSVINHLFDRGLLDRLESTGPGYRYELAEGVAEALEEDLRRRIEQLGFDIVDGFEVIATGEQPSADRILEDAFCPECGSTHPGSGVCESCREQDQKAREDLVADGGVRADRDAPRDLEYTERITSIRELLDVDLVDRRLSAVTEAAISPDMITVLAGARWAITLPTDPAKDLQLARASLEVALERLDDVDARYHARSALQWVAIAEKRLENEERELRPIEMETVRERISAGGGDP